MDDVAAACCATFYEQEAVRLILGDSYHPGGLALSRRLVAGLQVPLGGKILDVACGEGTSAVMMARGLGAFVTALDYSEKNLHRARSRATVQQVADRMEFIRGSAEALPCGDGNFQALICECAVSTFADKSRVASEFSRVLAPGGVLCVSDMAVEGVLPASLVERVGRWTCVADALSGQAYVDLFGAHGLTLVEHVDERGALLTLLSDLKRKLLLAGLGEVTGTLPKLDIDVRAVKELINLARTGVQNGALSYGRWVFSKGEPRFYARPDPSTSNMLGSAS